MAISLYDRGEAGDSMLSDEGAYILRQAKFLFESFLIRVEDNEAVDLRDLSTVMKDAVDDVILNEIIRRRLSAKPLRGERGTQGGDVLPATMDEDWNIKWICGSTANSHCVYDDETDPAHDKCVYCGEPQERK